MTWNMHLGRWQDALAHVDAVDAVICDPPYGERTHSKQYTVENVGSGNQKHREGAHFRKSIGYSHLTPSDVKEFVASWAPRTMGWMVCFTSHDLVLDYSQAMETAGRYVFAPLPWLNEGGPIRLSGDGPSSWTCWIVVSRPKNRKMQKWGTLPGGYHSPNKTGAGIGANAPGILGCKPLGLMRAIVRDYSRPGDLVCDPFVGSGTTLLAAVMEGRRAIGAEQKPEHYEIARRRLERGYTPSMFAGLP